jgi:hypothetical protein
LAAKVTQTTAERAGALVQGDSPLTPESCRLRHLRQGSVTFKADEDDVKMTKATKMTKTTVIVGADGMFSHVPPPKKRGPERNGEAEAGRMTRTIFAALLPYGLSQRRQRRRRAGIPLSAMSRQMELPVIFAWRSSQIRLGWLPLRGFERGSPSSSAHFNYIFECIIFRISIIFIYLDQRPRFLSAF